jgi:hypothetical protein
MVLMAAFLVFVRFILPIAGIVIGAILLNKKPNKKALGLTILIISILAFLAVAVWEIVQLSQTWA